MGKLSWALQGEVSPISATSVGRESRQFLVDISVVRQSHAHTGIQRVVRSLLRALIDARVEGYAVRPVYATRDRFYEYAAATDVSRIAGCDMPDLAEGHGIVVGEGDIFFGLDLAANLLPRHWRGLAHWRRCGCRISVMMYDLLPERRPDWFNPKIRRNYRRWLRTIAALSDDIICISEDVAEDLSRWLTARPWRRNRRLNIDWIRLGGDLAASVPTVGLPPDADALLSSFEKRRTLLVVGTIEPRKGHASLLPVFEAIWKNEVLSDPVLVFVGRPGWKTDALQSYMRRHREAAHRFFWFDDASDEFLGRLYDAATGVIVPSLAEGFGLPLAEAVAHGKPVLARNLPVFRAMHLPGVTYFDRDDPVSLGATITHWLGCAWASDLRGENDHSARSMAVPTWSDSLSDLLHCLSLTGR